MADVLLALRATQGCQKKRTLTMRQEGIDISGARFAWSEIDRVTYRAEERYLNGAYLGSTCTLEVGSADQRRMHFRLDSGVTYPLRMRDGEHQERDRAAWSHAVEILDERVGTRLISQALTSILRDGEATFAGLRLDFDGVHKTGILGKSLPWYAIAGAETRRQHTRILGYGGGRATAIARPVGAWNVVLLPRLIEALIPRLCSGDAIPMR